MHMLSVQVPDWHQASVMQVAFAGSWARHLPHPPRAQYSSVQSESPTHSTHLL